MHSTPKISLLAAIGKNRELGKRGDLIWRIKDDLKRFKALTTGHVMIAGRKTFEAMGVLPNRTTVVVTRDENYDAKGCILASSVEDALEKAKGLEAEEIFVVGGGEIYARTIPYADRLYLTLIEEEDKDADAFFPEYAAYGHVAEKSDLQVTEEGLAYTYVTLER